MADSSQTKKVLAEAMKSLMEREPFGKISVGDICSLCQMNRKSFYYHFRDKYDLVNWIFQTEFLLTIQPESMTDIWQVIEDLCRYFYDNRAFYYNALSVQGQNSFQDYFREIVAPVFYGYAAQKLTAAEDEEFFVNFYSDALIAAILRWLSRKDCMPPERFTGLLAHCTGGRGKTGEKKSD